MHLLLPRQYELILLERVDDVVREAGRRAESGADEGSFLVAVEQSDARTRSDALWFSPAGNAHCAIVLRPDFANARVGQLAYVAALSAGAALAGLLSPMTGLHYRWPNRILLNGLDAGRIMLAGPTRAQDPMPWLAVGLMMNVMHHPENPEPETYNSVHASGSPHVTVEALIEDFARHFLALINRWAENGFGPIARDWSGRANGFPGGSESGVGKDGERLELDGEGSLRIRSPSGESRRVSILDHFGFSWIDRRSPVPKRPSR